MWSPSKKSLDSPKPSRENILKTVTNIKANLIFCIKCETFKSFIGALQDYLWSTVWNHWPTECLMFIDYKGIVQCIQGAALEAESAI